LNRRPPQNSVLFALTSQLTCPRRSWRSFLAAVFFRHVPFIWSSVLSSLYLSLIIRCVMRDRGIFALNPSPFLEPQPPPQVGKDGSLPSPSGPYGVSFKSLVKAQLYLLFAGRISPLYRTPFPFSRKIPVPFFYVCVATVPLLSSVYYGKPSTAYATIVCNDLRPSRRRPAAISPRPLPLPGSFRTILVERFPPPADRDSLVGNRSQTSPEARTLLSHAPRPLVGRAGDRTPGCFTFLPFSSFRLTGFRKYLWNSSFFQVADPLRPTFRKHSSSS